MTTKFTLLVLLFEQKKLYKQHQARDGVCWTTQTNSQFTSITFTNISLQTSLQPKNQKRSKTKTLKSKTLKSKTAFLRMRFISYLQVCHGRNISTLCTVCYAQILETCSVRPRHDHSNQSETEDKLLWHFFL